MNAPLWLEKKKVSNALSQKLGCVDCAIKVQRLFQTLTIFKSDFELFTCD